VDAAGRLGWVGVVVDDDGFVAARVGSLADLLAWAEPVAAIGVDIPIGHATDGARRCDVEARRFVGPRSASVFAAPPADALAAGSYADANAALAARGAPMLSRQAWALVPRIVETAEVAASDDRVVEIHPEVCFRELSGGPLPWSKKTWNGLLLRRRLLAGAGIVLPDELGEAGGAVADDVVDAAAVAWSARRVAAGTAVPLPDPPEVHDGRRVAIWR
jgi:predicted RNase H-like nuclease